MVGARKTHLTEYEVQPDDTWKIFRQDDNSGYDPRKRPFYVLAKEKGKLAWTAPYMFFSQGVPGISCVVSGQQCGRENADVISVDFDLNAALGLRLHAFDQRTLAGVPLLRRTKH